MVHSYTVIEPVRTEEKARLKRELSKEAIARALDGKWERATEVNLQILRFFPEEVDALNRLGKAFLELGRYGAARAAFENALRIAPHNTITKKNLQRLAHLRGTVPPPTGGKVVTPRLFIEESGKSAVILLHNTAPPAILAKMAAGDSVMLERGDNALAVKNHQGEVLGQIEPKMGMRLMRLMKGGNRYDAAIVSINREEISVTIYETHRHPDLASVCSFPTRRGEEYKVNWRDALLRYELDSETEDDEGYAADWKESYPDASGQSDGEEPMESAYSSKSEKTSQEDDEV